MQGEQEFQFAFMAPLSLAIINKLKIMERFPNRIVIIHQKIVSFYGGKNGFTYTKLFLAQIISSIILFLTFFSLLAIISQDLVIFVYGLVFVLLLPILTIKGLDKKIAKKHNQMIIELPEFLNKVTLLVNAGETIQTAIIRSVEQKKEADKSFLYTELNYSVNQIKNNYPFNRTLEELSKRCGIQEVSIFTTTVLLNYRRGGEEFVVILKSLTDDLWERRKSLARTLGEQASSKLVFPMVLIFLIVMVIIATPALMLF